MSILEFKVNRNPSDAECTIGNQFYRIDGGDWIRHCWTLEDVIREVPGEPVEQWKIWGKTAIPAGKYKMVLDFSPHFKRILPHILGVPGFTEIRQHGGNKATDTDGCTLLAVNHPSEDLIQGSEDAVDGVVGLLSSHCAEAWIEFLNPGQWS